MMPGTKRREEASLVKRKEEKNEKGRFGDELIRLPFLSLPQHQCKGSQGVTSSNQLREASGK